MTFKARNAYYLRISSSIVLPLYLYLDERHIDWMSDVVLQHVLADLRPLIIPKLHAEKDIHFGPGGASGNKPGTVEVHRGETYQFAYFFRKTEPHTVLFKSRYFVAAPARPQVTPVSVPSRPVPRDNSKKRARSQVTPKHGDRKRAKTKGKDKASHNSFDDEEEWSVEESEEDSDVDDLPAAAREPRLQRRRRSVANTYREDEDDDVAMGSPQHDTDEGSSGGPSRPTMPENGENIEPEENDQQNLSKDTPDIELVVEEEETKPKPLLKLKYQSFPISGHCLCVVVEPWPLQRTATQLQPQGLLAGNRAVPRRGTPQPATSDSIVAGQRAKTPLFLPEYDRAPSEAPFARERTVPPPPLFSDGLLTIEDENDNDDLMDFSQLLNSTGHMHANVADDDDDMDGAVLFGDADETRELL